MSLPRPSLVATATAQFGAGESHERDPDGRIEQLQVTVPRNRDVRIATLDAIIAGVARFLGLPKQVVRDTLLV